MPTSKTCHQPAWLGNAYAATRTIVVISPTNPPRQAARPRRRSPIAGGCDFPIAPAQSALEASPCWTPAVDIGAHLVVASPLAPAEAAVRAKALAPRLVRPDPGGASLLLGAPPDEIHIVLATDVSAEQPLAVIVPLDAATPARLASLDTLWRGLVRPRAASRARVTSQRRARIKAMLRAVDAHAAGASHRDLAQALFGPQRVAAEPWKTSPLRDTAMRLSRDGAALVQRGYREILGGVPP